MKTPDEIKKGLEQCAETETCENCDYRDDCMIQLKNAPLTKDALAYIQQLESRLAQVEREMDAAVEDFTRYVNYGERECKMCRHKDEVCLKCVWEWRGVTANDDR